MTTLLDKLLSQRWQALHSEERDLVSLNGDRLRYPGVYIFAYSRKPMDGQRVRVADVFYVGMSNSAGGVRKRLKQFQSAIEGRGGHGPGDRFFRVCANGRKFSRFKTPNRYFYAACTIRCESRKGNARADDYRQMGRVAQLEYNAIAHVLERTGRLPPLNDLVKSALDAVM